MKTITISEVVDSVRDWGRIRLLVLAVKEARNSCRCEVAYRGCGDPYDAGEPPCWQANEWDHESGPASVADWCEPCLKRHKWHMALVAIKRMHGGRLRRLQRVAIAPMKVAMGEMDYAAESRGLPDTDCPMCLGQGRDIYQNMCSLCGATCRVSGEAASAYHAGDVEEAHMLEGRDES